MNSKISNGLDGINVRYIYSACIIISTPDAKILCDPWFSEGIYDGAWYHFPVIEDPIKSIGDVDLIYVSHIHPDHYDGDFLKKYFKVYGEKKIIIADHNPNYLLKKMMADGINSTILRKPLIVNNTEIKLVPHETGSISDIDSAIIVKYKTNKKTHCVVNANDIIFDEKMRGTLKNEAGEVDILLCGYTGAGPYPQTYFDTTDPQIEVEARNKKNAFFERYKTLTNCINATVNIPFAGKYLLGGKLSFLNKYRGVSDSVEVTAFDNNAVILCDNGGEINTADFKASCIRDHLYSEKEIQTRIDEISSEKMAYEKLIALDEIHQLPLKRLFFLAAKNAHKFSECPEDYYFCITLTEDEYGLVNANKDVNDMRIVNKGSDLPEPRSEIIIDPRYLFGLFTNIYHWNNAEVGSQYFTRRYPNVLNRKAQSFLNYFSI